MKCIENAAHDFEQAPFPRLGKADRRKFQGLENDEWHQARMRVRQIRLAEYRGRAVRGHGTMPCGAGGLCAMMPMMNSGYQVEMV